MIDAEYESLCAEINSYHHSSHNDENVIKEQKVSQQNFKTVLQAHKNYLAAVIRLSMVDNAIVQDAIERVLQVCLRFIAIYHYLMEEDQDVSRKQSEIEHETFNITDTESSQSIHHLKKQSSIPLQEVDALKKDFFSQISYFLQIMRKVET